MQLNRIVIIGAGAVGGSIGGLTARNGTSVAVVARGANGLKIREAGITVHRPFESFAVQPECFNDISEVDWGDGDVAVLATKLNDGEAALDALRDAAEESLPVVCATNGIHGERWAAERFRHVISMMIWMPATYLTLGEVSVYGGNCPGVLDCGPVQNDAELKLLSNQFCSCLRSAGFESLSRSDIGRWKNAKWLTNLANTAQALVVDDWKSVAKAAQSEGKAVLEKAGIDIATVDELRERTACVNLLPINGANRPGGSTWQSLKRGKPLESPWLEGAMAELGQTVGVPTPVNQALSEAGKELRKLHADKVLSL